MEVAAARVASAEESAGVVFDRDLPDGGGKNLEYSFLTCNNGFLFVLDAMTNQIIPFARVFFTSFLILFLMNNDN